MRIQFCANGYFNGYSNVIAEFNVMEVPTNEECEAIENEILEAMGKWAEENNDDFEEFDFWEACYDAAIKHIHIINNSVVKTFHIKGGF